MAGTVTGSFTRIPTQQGRPQMAKLVLAFTADETAHTFPSTVLNDLPAVSGLFTLEGLQLYSIKCIPYAVTPPTGGGSITVTDEYGLDLLGGKGSGMISNTNKTWALFGPSESDVCALVTGDITINVSGNSVNSAKLTIIIEFIGV
jgi:hypothetical protein